MQQLNPSEISDLIKQRIDQVAVVSQATNEGTIVSVTDGIIRIHGLTEVQYGEMIEFEGGVFGLALTSSAIQWARWFWAIISSWQKVKPVAARAAS